MYTSNVNSVQANKYWCAFLAIFVIPISGLSIDIYVPSLPAVSHYFNTDQALSQLTITAYMLGLGLTQLFAGSISDSFGRKTPFLIAMSIYILTNLLIPFSHTIYQLIFLRALQGIMVALTVVPMRSVIPDLFEGHEFYKMMSYLTIAWTIGPIVAPAIGGCLQHHFGWQANFYFLAIYSTISIALIVLFLPETSIQRHPFHLSKILQRYQEILSHTEYLRALMINGLLYSILILFSIVGSFLIQNNLHYSAITFGNIALSIGFAWFLGGIIYRLTIKMDVNFKTKICLWMMLGVAVLMLISAIFIATNIYIIVIPIILLSCLGGILFPNNFACAMALFPKMTGSANALLGGFIFIISGASSGFGTLLKAGSQLPLAIAYIGIISVCLSIFYLARRRAEG